MQPRKIHPEDELKIEQIAKQTGIPLERLRQAALGRITLTRDEYEDILEGNTPLPRGIKKPFGN